MGGGDRTPRSEGPVCYDWTQSPSVGARGSEGKGDKKWEWGRARERGRQGHLNRERKMGCRQGNEGERGSLSAC